jgi:hypothetical protein
VLWKEKAVFARKEKDDMKKKRNKKKRNKKSETSNAQYADHAKTPFPPFIFPLQRQEQRTMMVEDCHACS